MTTLLLLLWLALLPAGKPIRLQHGRQQVQAPLRAFTGRIMTPERSPLSGATILVKGTSMAVSTNADGSFLLSLPVGPHRLVVDYPAYRTVEVAVEQPDSVLVIVLHSTQPPVPHRRSSAQ